MRAGLGPARRNGRARPSSRWSGRSIAGPSRRPRKIALADAIATSRSPHDTHRDAAATRTALCRDGASEGRHRPTLPTCSSFARNEGFYGRLDGAELPAAPRWPGAAGSSFRMGPVSVS